jgi:hypothetical protein
MFSALDYQSWWRRATVQRSMYETPFGGFTNFVSKYDREFAIAGITDHEKGGRLAAFPPIGIGYWQMWSRPSAPRKVIPG